MMIGSGSIQSMIKALKNNRALLNRRNHLFQNKQAYLKSLSNEKLSYKKATNKELEVIREKIKQQKKNELMRYAISMVTASILTIGLIYVMLKII